MVDSAGGLIRFTFRKVLPTITAKIPVLGSGDVQPATGIAPVADQGFEGAILIGVVSKNPNVKWAGMAGGSYMWINGDWGPRIAAVVTHEFGHNLGLLHANSAVCTNVLPVVCDQLEYGDNSSIMGSYAIGYASQPYIARFSATELDLLKVLPEESKTVAVDSGEYKLAPVYSQGSKIPKVIYIPIGNENIYSIEYRPAQGVESGLAQTQLQNPGENFAYVNLPSYGLQLRVLQATSKAYTSIQPKINNVEFFGTGLVSDSLTGPQIQPNGKNFLLSDGSIVSFVSSDPISGALVKVVRPVDNEAPKIESINARWPYDTYYLGPKGERLVKHKSPTEWNYPLLTVPISGVSDNRLLKTIELEVNGQVVQSVSGAEIKTTNEFIYQTNSVGSFTLRLIATDYAGNKSQSDSNTFITDYFYLWKPGVVTNLGPDPFTSLKFNFFRAGEDVTYQVSELSAGTVKSIEAKNGQFEITIVDIPRNSTISAKLIGSNPSGETDGGQTITGTPQKAECTNSNCFVGMPWTVETGYFGAGAGIMSLQEKIESKWVTVKSAKPYSASSPYKKYPIGYAISLTYASAGKHIYRLVIAPSKKFSAYTGPTFTQFVQP